MTRFCIYIILITAICSCRQSSAADDGETESYISSPTSESEYSDGTWCASVDYYNPNTGTSNTYSLDVEVENGELVRIDWPNGGWLDESHFRGEDISSGECSFTSDKGYDYTVNLESKGGCSYSESSNLGNQIREDQAAVTCPKCGDSKETYDDLCYMCDRKKKDREEQMETCPKCYGYKNDWESICTNCVEERREALESRRIDDDSEIE